jgi:hypothetical protein
MRVVNVITNVDNAVKDIESFGVFEEQLADDVAKEAEDCFVKKLREFINGDETDEQLIEDAIENGYYEDSTKGYFYICIVWSYIGE